MSDSIDQVSDLPRRPRFPSKKNGDKIIKINDVNRQIMKVIEEHPEIGGILDKYGIGSIKWSISTCLLQDVVSMHRLGNAVEEQIEKEINTYLANLEKP